MNLQSGEIFANSFEIGALIGRGSFATVYKATQRGLNRAVALKVLDAIEPEALARFQREAQLASSLRHKNICSCLVFGATGNTPYMALEYLEGETLRTVLKKRESLPWNEASEIALQICAGLKAAHAAGITHRDLKPENIILTIDSTLKIVDFGLAASSQSSKNQKLTQTGMVVGTVSYMSPEQCLGKPVDARSDIFSLGCILFELVTGSPPFGGNSLSSIMMKRFTQHSDISEVASVPRAFRHIVEKSMSQLAEDRYCDVDELAQALQRVLNEQERYDATIGVWQNWRRFSATVEKLPQKWRKFAAGYAIGLLTFMVAASTYYLIQSTALPAKSNSIAGEMFDIEQLLKTGERRAAASNLRSAINLAEARNLADSEPNSMIALYGMTRSTLDVTEAEMYLQKALTLAKQNQLGGEIMRTSLSLGMVMERQGKDPISLWKSALLYTLRPRDNAVVDQLMTEISNHYANSSQGRKADEVIALAKSYFDNGASTEDAFLVPMRTILTIDSANLDLSSYDHHRLWLIKLLADPKIPRSKQLTTWTWLSELDSTLAQKLKLLPANSKLRETFKLAMQNSFEDMKHAQLLQRSN